MTSIGVAIRADGSASIGSGHVMRCLTLAQELRRRGAVVQFLCRPLPGHYITAIELAGFPVHVLPAGQSSTGVAESDDAVASVAALGRGRPDWVIVDHYALGRMWERSMRAAGSRVLAVDDLARQHEADAVLDQNWFGQETESRYGNRVQSSCRLLLGPRYGLLQPIYPLLRAAIPPRAGVIRRVLVFLGGSDPDNRTQAAMEALCDPALAHLAVDVVLGANHHAPDAIDRLAQRRPGTRVHKDLPTLAGLLGRADLAIGAGGITTWERSCLGLPAIVTVIAPNQDQPARALAAAGCHVVLGGVDESPSVAAWTEAIRWMIEHPEDANTLGRASARLIDGLGASRIAWFLTSATPPHIVIRPARRDDEALLLEWVNDPAVRAAAFQSAPVAEADHHRWFDSRVADPGCFIVIGEDPSGLPLGQVRFEQTAAGDATIDISVDRVARGRGTGHVLLREALTAFGRHWPGTTATAEVKVGNMASVRLFQSTGFTEWESARPGVRRFRYSGGASA